jgi:hypothetical protein
MSTNDGVGSVNLGILELLRIVAGVVPDYQQFVSEAARCDFIAGEEYAGWNGIDCKLCVILIHLAVEHSKSNTYYLPSFTKKSVSTVYTALYLEYEKACRNVGLPFVPCTKGLSTILKRADKRVGEEARVYSLSDGHRAAK